MTLGEIIALAKAGYRKQDIDDLLKIQIDEPDPDPDPGADPDSTEPDTGSKGDPGASPEDPEDKPDYEDMYSSLKEEFDKLKEDLKKAQEKNIHKNNGGDDPDPYKDLGEALRGYM